MSNLHVLKTVSPYFEAISDGSKTFEIRKNDRDFKKGDLLLLAHYYPDKKTFGGNRMLFKVSYMTDFEQKKGNVVLGLKLLPTGDCTGALINKLLEFSK